MICLLPSISLEKKRLFCNVGLLHLAALTCTEIKVLCTDWRDIDAFQESLKQSKDRKPFSFYVCSSRAGW